MIYQPPQLQYRGILKSLLDRLLPQSLPLVPNTPPITSCDWRVQTLQCYINTAHGKLGCNLDAICKELQLGVSGSHGARLFKKHTGLGIREYSKQKRLALAAEKLRNTSLSVKEIAADLGYRSQTDLSRQFKHVFHLSPTEFRNAHRELVHQSMKQPPVPQAHDLYSELLLEEKSGTR